jgi:hypothetical protein
MLKVRNMEDLESRLNLSEPEVAGILLLELSNLRKRRVIDFNEYIKARKMWGI